MALLRIALWTALAILAGAGAARAGAVRTAAGAIHEGDIALAPGNRLVVAAPGRPPVSVPLADVAAATFRPSIAPPAEPTTRPVTAPGDSALPPLWQAVNVGQNIVDGETRYAYPRTFIVTGAGMDVGYKKHPEVDSFHFVCQRLIGDGQVVGRLVSVEGFTATRRVGFMIRQDLGDSSPFAMAAVFGGAFASLRYRERENTMAAELEETVRLRELPVWLKIQRKGDLFAAFHSADGQAWKPLGAVRVAMKPETLVGMVVSSRDRRNLATARFEKVRLAAGPPDAPQAPAPGRPLSGFVLKTGTIVAARATLDAATLTFARDGEPPRSLPRPQIARILFVQPDADIPLPEHGREGVALDGGDFMDAQVRSFDGTRVEAESVLFGHRRMDVQRDAVAAALLAPIEPAPAAYTVATDDGSLYRATRLSTEDGHLILEEPRLGPLRLPARHLVYIEAITP